MKTNPSSFLNCLFLFCFIFLARSSAQTILKKGYYQPISDSIPVNGYFDLTLSAFNSIPFYKQESKDKTLELYPADVSSIHTEDGSFLLPIRLKTQDGFSEIFANRIFNAEVSLFEGRIHGEDVFFLYSNKLPELKRINKQAPEIFLRTYLGEKCGPDRSVKYAKYNLTEALKKYTICSGAEFKAPPKNHFKLNLALGLRAGFYHSSPKVTGFFGNEYNTLSGPIIGGDFQIGIIKNLFARIGFAYNQSTLLKEKGKKVGYKFRGWPFTYTDPLQFSYTTYEFPFELVWQFNKGKKIAPFVGIGINYIRTTIPTTEQYFTVPDPFDYGFYSFNEVDILNSLLGQMKVEKQPSISGQLKGGGIIRLKNKSFFELDFRYAPRKQAYYLDTTNNNFPLLVNNSGWLDLSLAYYLPLTH